MPRRRSIHLALLAVAASGAGVSAPTPAMSARHAISVPSKSAPSSLRPIEAVLQTLVATDTNFHLDPGRALDALSGATRLEFYGMRPILSDTLQHQFLGLSTDRLRREWVRRYWGLRDPTPTTPENERLTEHRRRVMFAGQNFGLAEPPYFDARGAFYIQFGAPETMSREAADVREGLAYIPRRETWIYSGGGMVAQFEQPTPGAAWILGNTSAKQTNRPDLLHDAIDPSHDHSIPDLDRPALAELAPGARAIFWDAWLPTSETMAAVAAVEAGGESFTMPGPPRRFLPYVFDADVFRGAPRRPRVEVHVQIDLHELEFAPASVGFLAHYAVEGVLLDDSVRVAARTAYEDSVHVDSLATTQKSTLWPGQLDFDVPPGAYRLALRVVDEETNAEGLYAADVHVPPLDAAGLQLSDLEFATRIDSLAPGTASRFAKQDRLVIPNPVARYRRGRQLTGYFEIYGLALDANHRSRYEVTYTFAPKSKLLDQGWFPKDKPLDKPVVSSSFTGVGHAATVVEELRVDVGSLDEDTYDLLLSVRDLQANTVATSRSRFRVVR